MKLLVVFCNHKYFLVHESTFVKRLLHFKVFRLYYSFSIDERRLIKEWVIVCMDKVTYDFSQQKYL
jgi:hypothetical protein